jgi:single-stranded DNA-specific DHH superfamily exonuclease
MDAQTKQISIDLKFKEKDALIEELRKENMELNEEIKIVRDAFFKLLAARYHPSPNSYTIEDGKILFSPSFIHSIKEEW